MVSNSYGRRVDQVSILTFPSPFLFAVLTAIGVSILWLEKYDFGFGYGPLPRLVASFSLLIFLANVVLTVYVSKKGWKTHRMIGRICVAVSVPFALWDVLVLILYPIVGLPSV